MNFATAVEQTRFETRTENGMVALQSSTDALVDLFYGATRGVDIVPKFVGAYVENRELALRVAQWVRDVRGGSGERELMKQILQYLEVANPSDCELLLKKLPTIGRWDDGLCLKTAEMKKFYFGMIRDAIQDGKHAKLLLASLENLSEEECSNILKSF